MNNPFSHIALTLKQVTLGQDPYSWCAILTTPNGRQLRGPPQFTCEVATHKALEAYHGETFAEPFPEHLEPMTRHTVELVRVVYDILWRLEEVIEVLAAAAPDHADLPTEVADKVAMSFVGVRWLASEATALRTCMEAMRRDEHAEAMLCHPLWNLAEQTAESAMRYAELIVAEMGRPDLLSHDGKEWVMAFDPAATDDEWAAALGRDWWEKRAERVKVLAGWCDGLASTDLDREAHFREILNAMKCGLEVLEAERAT